MLQHSIPHPTEQKNASYAVGSLLSSLLHWGRCRPLFQISKIGCCNSPSPDMPERLNILARYRFIRCIRTHGYMVCITRLLRHATLFSLFFLASSASVYASDYEHSYKNPGTTNAHKYIISTRNIEVINPEFDLKAAYWKPIVGDETINDTTPGEIIYRIPLDKPMIDAKLYMRTTACHWEYSKGYCLLRASLDGKNWKFLAEARTPSLGKCTIGSYNGHLPSNFKGATSIYLSAVLYSYGRDAHMGGARTNTAQHSRYDYAYDNVPFKIAVNYEDRLIDIEKLRITTTYWSKTEEETITIDMLVPGESSEISLLRIINPKTYPISGATLTYGLSVSGADPFTIGSIKNIDIDAGSSRWLSAAVKTPLRDRVYPTEGNLVIVLKDSNGVLLDKETKRVGILDERYIKNSSLFGAYMLLLLRSGLD